MELVEDNVFAAEGNSRVSSSGVFHRDGLFYARLQLNEDPAPFLVALHGISSEPEALKAWEQLTKLGPFR
jgi:hypothetical protein